jgi:16S rRNA (cytosine1402-N4)-methyltransferase
VSEFVHATVMLRQTVEGIGPRADGTYVDATLGGAGHAEAVLQASSPHGKLYGIDRDPAALEAARLRLSVFGERAVLLHGAFGDAQRLLAEHGITQVDGVIADLGVSSPQLDRGERGFSFGKPGPLDMRMDPTSGEPLIERLHAFSTDELANVLYEYGEERKSRPIARSIKAALERGELQTTEDLRRAVVRVLGPKRSGIDPATRTFQALRIAVNDELGLLVDGGRVAIISFHSGEDRIVKHAFRDDARMRPLTKRPIEADAEECATNPRARSAKLRVAERVPREIAP